MISWAAQKKLCVILILGSIFPHSLFAEETSQKEPSLAVLPLLSSNVQGYIPRVMDKLIAAKIEKVKIYRVIPSGEIQKFIRKYDISLKKELDFKELQQYAVDNHVDQILYGVLEKSGTAYRLNTKIYDVAQKRVVLENSEKAADIRQLNTAANALVRRIVRNLFPSDLARAEKILDAEADTKKEAQMKKSLSYFADIAEKNPQKALKMVNEPARKAIESSVKKKVKKEEIKNLFEREKKAKEHAAKKKRETWTLAALQSVLQVGNITGFLAVNRRIDSLLDWNYYMNNMFMDTSYGNYTDSFDSYQGFQTASYMFTQGPDLWLTYAYKKYLPDVLTFSQTGRLIFTLSNMMQISGALALTATSQLGFIAQRKYLEYVNATDDFTEKYDTYRNAHVWPEISRYATLGLWTLGISGMVTAALLPGNDTPLILSEKSRKRLFWGQFLVTLGNLTSGLATNFRGKAEEAWVTDHSDSSIVGESNYSFYYNTSEVFYYSTYALFLGSAVLTYLGLMDDSSSSVSSSKTDRNSGLDALSFSILPAENGFTAAVNVRLY